MLLDEMIDSYVKTLVNARNAKGMPVNPTATQSLRDGIYNQVLEEALDKIREAKIQQLDSDLAKREKAGMDTAKARIAKFKISQVSSIIVETIFLAFFVGLVVNQITTWFDGCFTPFSGVITLVFCSAVLLLKHLLTSSKLKEGDDAND